MPTDAGVLACADAIRDNLTEEIQGQRTVDRNEFSILRDDRRRIHPIRGQEPHFFPTVEPVVEFPRAHGERSDRITVIDSLPIRDLSRLVQAHEPRRKHLGVDPVVAAGAIDQQIDELAGYTADSDLDRRAAFDEGQRSLGNRLIDGSAGWIGENEWSPVTFDDYIHLFDGKCVREFGRDSQRPRQRGIHFHDEQPLRITTRVVQGLDGGSRVERQAHLPVFIRRCRSGRHDPWAPGRRDFLKSTEVGGHETHVVAGRAESALHGPEESAAQPDAASGEDAEEVNQ